MTTRTTVSTVPVDAGVVADPFGSTQRDKAERELLTAKSNRPLSMPTEPSDPKQDQTTVENRWWVDTTDKKRTEAPRPPAPVGMSFFRAGIGFEQERARDCLTDNNLKLLQEANPEEGSWTYLQLTEKRHPHREQDRIRRALKLPPYARALLVDSGRVVRVLVSGTPLGERILEFTFGYAPSFDCWVRDEWIEERVFKKPADALRAAPKLIRRYLAPDEIARDEAVAPRV